MYLFSNVIGVFVFDEKINLAEELEFKGIAEYQNKEELANKIKNKHKNLKEPDENTIKKILVHFKDKKYHSKFREMNLAITKLDVKNSVNEDVLIIQAVKSIEELDGIEVHEHNWAIFEILEQKGFITLGGCRGPGRCWRRAELVMVPKWRMEQAI